jgi:hypothetical protein
MTERPKRNQCSNPEWKRYHKPQGLVEKRMNAKQNRESLILHCQTVFHFVVPTVFIVTVFFIIENDMQARHSRLTSR